MKGTADFCLRFCCAACLELVLVLLLRRQAAADVALGLVDVQNDAGLGGEGRVDVDEAVGNVLMYCCRKLERWLQGEYG